MNHASAISARRAGISLIEILMSIAVVAIGLLGVAAMIPLAHHKAAQGVRSDRIGEFGRAAFREFRVREFDKPGDYNRPYWVPVYLDSNAQATTGPQYWIYNFGTGQLDTRPYCFDPVGVAEAGMPFFPVAGPLQIPRVTALSSRLDDLVPSSLYSNKSQVDQALLQSAVNNRPIINAGQARRCFELQDDISFLRTEPDRPVVSKYFGSGVNLRRESSGEFSWMATLQPEVIGRGNQYLAYRDNGRYDMSVVIFEKRRPSVSPSNELVASAILNGYGTDPRKEVVLSQITAPNPGDIRLSDMRKNDWVMLGRILDATTGVRVIRWYKVISIDEPESELDQDRIVTLEGPDWPYGDSLSDPSKGPLFAVYVRDVVAVYEKSIRLQR
ncbi:MAG: hypothetical protein KDA87_19850 [Planctomycetales bacterium]|nr:hypothetical protein [Planctomycetales bacterium]